MTDLDAVGPTTEPAAVRRRTGATLLKFGAVGVSGLVVNLAALAVLSSLLHLHYLIGVVLATQVSTTWNYILSDRYVFGQAPGGWRQSVRRYVQYAALNNSALLGRGPLIVFLTEVIGIQYLASNFVSLALFTLIRFELSYRFIWRSNHTRNEPNPESALDGGPEIGDVGSAETIVPGAGGPQPGLESPTVALLDRSKGAEHQGTTVRGTLARRLPTFEVSSTKAALIRVAWSWAWPVLGFLAVALPAIWLRVVALDAIGLNSDEIVYGGQGASIAGDPVSIKYFPIFRAHPLLFQTTLSIVFRDGMSPYAGRLTAVAFGLGTVVVVYLIGRSLYGNLVGFLSAAILAVMPYHVVVSRQILLDGPMVFFSTLGLFCLARYALSDRGPWLYSAAAVLGLMFVTNERSIVLFGGMYGFFAMSSQRAIPLRRLITAGIVLLFVALPYPLSIKYSGRSSTGEQFLAWQLFRRANHPPQFYILTIPPALGLMVVGLAIAGFVICRKRTWREALLVWWIAVPVIFFQVFNVKGYQYLLPIAPAMAVLAARTLGAVFVAAEKYGRASVPSVLALMLAAMTIIVPAGSSWRLIDPSRPASDFVAGTGGVPGGREAGTWVRENVPEGAILLTVGPSMANIMQFYGDRKTFGLSVSPNPLHRNPVYEPVINPDLRLRSSEIQYLVWDSFSAGRSEFFSQKLLTFAERYHGRVVHTEYIKATDGDGVPLDLPIIIIYEVRP